MPVCIICLDFSRIKGKREFKWMGEYIADNTTPVLTAKDLENAILTEFDQKIAELPRTCPTQCPIILQLCFHLDLKVIMAPPPQAPMWDQGASAAAVLASLGARPTPPQIDDIYLKSCESVTQGPAINSAFTIPSVKRVFTADKTLLAACSDYMTGAQYPTFRPIPMKIQIWTNPTTNTEVSLDSKKKYMMGDGSVQDWSTAMSP